MVLCRWAIYLCVVVSLGACGGIPTREEIADRIAESALESVQEAIEEDSDDRSNIQVFEETKRAVEPVANTAFEQMPTSGAARFAGAGQITVSPPGGADNRRYVGRANALVDFASNAVVGRLDQFTRRSNGRDVTGNISIRNGDFAINRPNDFAADFSGTLRDGNNTIVLDGRFLGDFKGTPIRGMSVRVDDLTGLWNGEPMDHALTIFMERQ